MHTTVVVVVVATVTATATAVVVVIAETFEKTAITIYREGLVIDREEEMAMVIKVAGSEEMI